MKKPSIWQLAIYFALCLAAGRASVPVFPNYWPGGDVVQPAGSGPAWEAFADYRQRGAETWDEAADRISDFESDAEAHAFIREAFEQHRRVAFADRLGPIEQDRMYDGDEWQPDEAAKLWREFAESARGGDAE